MPLIPDEFPEWQRVVMPERGEMRIYLIYRSDNDIVTQFTGSVERWECTSAMTGMSESMRHQIVAQFRVILAQMLKEIYDRHGMGAIGFKPDAE